MDKTTRTVAAVVLVVLTVVALAICQNQMDLTKPSESVETLWEKIDAAMSAVDSMEITATTERVYYHMGQRYEYTGTNYVLSTKQAHYTHSKDVTVCSSLSLEQTMERVEAYYDGKMYRSVQNGKYDQKFCSEISHEQYDQIQSEGVGSIIPLIGCTKSSFSGSETEGWVLSFGGYNEEAIEFTLADMGLTETELGGTIEDMSVKISVSADFYVQSVDIVFEFAEAEGENMPSLCVRTTYAGMNEVSFDPEMLQPEEYVAVEDFRILEKVSAAIAQRQSAQDGRFELTINTTDVYRQQTIKHTQTSIVTYGWKDGGYFYHADAKLDDKSFVRHYEDGVETVIPNSSSSSEIDSDLEAEAFVDGLIDTAKYDPLAISNIEKLEEGVYLLSCNTPNLWDYDENIEVTSADQQIKVTFKDDKLVKMESVLTLSGILAGETLEMKNESTILFTEATEIPETPEI